MNIVDLAILKKMVAGGGGSGTDNYNDLSNLPQINGETLAGNKTAANLGLQDALTFDSAPTEDSTNPVESGGVYNALAGKQDNLTFDDDPTENSTNPVKSGGVYSALAGKQDNLTFDGVYNASTNKAATESTVTNAIAGLDVSALSVDADETISSISETDGKINVTKQDIAIVSNQVTAMTGYTKPSSAPATPAIQTSDTANQAFGKLEFKADTNQSNILYALGKTGHNLLEVTAVSGTVGGVNYTINKNSITISANGSSTTSTLVLNSGSPLFEASDNIFAINKVMPVGATITVKYTDGTIIGFNSNNRNTNATLNNSKDVESVYIYIEANATISDTIDVMICTQEDWAITHEITPYQGKPNYDLTRLEAEDRAALAEEIDAGAKNRLDFATWAANVNVTRGTKTVSGNSITLTATGNDCSTKWNPGDSGEYIYKIPVTAGEKLVLSWNANTSTTGKGRVFIFYNGVAESAVYTDTNNKVLEATIPSGCTFITFRFGVETNGDSITYSNIMLCTKAAFGVSQKFVPYRYDPYTTVWQNVANATLYARRNGRTVTINGYVDNVSFTAGSNTSLGTINNEIGKPLQQVRAICSIGVNAYSIGEPSYLTIATDGNVVVNPKTYTGTGAVFFSVSYTI